MKSLDTLLAEAVEKMKPATRKRFAEQTRGERISQESLVNVAESMVAEDGEVSIRESRQPIRRNNGAQGPIDESEHSPEKSEALLLEGLRKARPQAFEKLTEQTTSHAALSESQRKEYDFCRMLRMSESDALKVARAS